MAVKKSIQTAMAGGAKVVTALYMTFDIDPYWDNWGRCCDCRVYLHNSELGRNDIDGDICCPFCKGNCLESLPDQRYYGMTPTQRYRAQEHDADVAWYDSVRL